MRRILCGPQAVREALRADPKRVVIVYAMEGTQDDVAELARRGRVALEERPREDVEALAREAGLGGRHQGVVAITGEYPYRSLPEILGSDGTHLLVVCDEIQDPQNLGAIARSVVFFGGTGIVVGKQRAAPVTAGAVRASAGATEHARIARVGNIAETLRALDAEGIRTVGLDADAPVSIANVDLRGPVALVVGSEGKGLRRLTRERCQALARIPASGPLASLNASVACAVALYEVRAQRSREEQA